MYDVFIRNWWKWEYTQFGKRLIPHAGRKTYIKKNVTEESARDICRVYNANHNPGVLSRKAEYESR
jgi:hypothetical protein